MNERLLDFLRKSEMKKLAEEKRKLYEFITDAEDILATKAATADEFLSMVLEESPINAAASRFNLPYDQVVSKLADIEEELHVKIQQRSEKVKWIDFSDKVHPGEADGRETRLFLFMN